MKFTVSLFAVVLGFVTAYGASAANANSLNKRVQKLETKTDYYQKKNKVFRKSKNRFSSAIDGSRNAGLQCREMEVYVDPKFTAGGSVYVWVKAKVKYSGSLEAIASNVLFKNGSGQITMSPAEITNLSGPSGVAEVKQAYGMFYIPAGTSLGFRVERMPYMPDGRCIESVEMELKTTLIEVQDPDF